MDGIELLKVAKNVTPKVIYYLPRNFSHKQAKGIFSAYNFEYEKNFLNDKLKTVTIYFDSE